MKICYITAGAAGMYCGSCLRDNTLVGALRALGVEGILVPTYTPLRGDGEDLSERRIFLGGISVYLAQRFPWWRRAPRWLNRLLDARALLGAISRLASMNRPGELGELTLSILDGERGNQAAEIEDLIRWLAEEARPDLVHLTNSLFAGLAPALRRRLGVPVLCTLQGEDIFLEGLAEPWRGRALERIREASEDIDAFTAVSRYYRDFMAGYLGIAPERIRVIPPGIPVEPYLPAVARRRGAAGGDTGGGAARPLAIGYLARICRDKGVGLLAEAFARLKTFPGTENVRLRIAGYLGRADRPFLRQVVAGLAAQGLERDVEVLGTLDFEDKVRFLSEIDIFSAPAVYREPKGLYVLEAMASGLPVVLPRHGAFPELVESTGGGLLVDPDSPEALAEGLHRLVRDAARRRELGERGSAAVAENYSARRMAEATLAVYREFIPERASVKLEVSPRRGMGCRSDSSSG